MPITNFTANCVRLNRKRTNKNWIAKIIYRIQIKNESKFEFTMEIYHFSLFCLLKNWTYFRCSNSISKIKPSVGKRRFYILYLIKMPFREKFLNLLYWGIFREVNANWKLYKNGQKCFQCMNMSKKQITGKIACLGLFNV